VQGCTPYGARFFVSEKTMQIYAIILVALGTIQVSLYLAMLVITLKKVRAERILASLDENAVESPGFSDDPEPGCQPEQPNRPQYGNPTAPIRYRTLYQRRLGGV
jgi:hypothetical protein